MGQDRTGPVASLSSLSSTEGNPAGTRSRGQRVRAEERDLARNQTRHGPCLGLPSLRKKRLPFKPPGQSSRRWGDGSAPFLRGACAPARTAAAPGADVGSRQAHCCGGELGTRCPAAAGGPSLARAGRTLTQQTACGGRASASGPGQAGHSGRPTAPGARARPGWGAGTECGSSEAAQGLRRSFVGAGGGPRCQTPPTPLWPGRLVLPGNGASNAARRGPGPTGCAARTPPDPPPPRALVLGSEWPQAGLLGSDLAKRPE